MMKMKIQIGYTIVEGRKENNGTLGEPKYRIWIFY